jgi:two-component system chemotaxis sensor kinase CheA
VAESLEQLRARLRVALRARLEQVVLAFEHSAGAPHDRERRQRAITGLHTLKGEARLLGLTAFAARVHELESSAGDGCALGALSGALEGLRASLNEPETNAENSAARARSRHRPLEQTLLELARHAQARAESAGKLVHVVVSAPRVELSAAQLDCLRPALLHLLENALDHGLETPQERGAKAALGRLVLRAELADGRLSVVCEDDGRGIDLNQIRAGAVRRGELSAEAAAGYSREQLYELLFEHGYSTASQITSSSGRGVGLDAVRRHLRELGGDVSLDSEPGRGTRFVLSLPFPPSERDRTKR